MRRLQCSPSPRPRAAFPEHRLRRSSGGVASPLVIAALLGCGPLRESTAASSDDSTSTTATASGASTSMGSTTAAVTTHDAGGSSTGTSSPESDDDDGGVPFIVSPDGGPASGCEQPGPTAQAATCDDGIRQPGELCYRGAASRYAMPEGLRLVDFGDGPRVAYVDLGFGVPLVPATIEGMLESTLAFDPPGSEYGLAIDDVDGDDRLDLVIAIDETLSVFRGLGDGTFEQWTTSPLSGMAHLQLGDLDGDGRRDLVGTTSYYYETGDLHLALAQVGGAFVDAGTTDLGEYIHPRTGDFDGDGLADIAALVVTDFRTSDREILTVPMTPGGLGSPAQLDADDSVGLAVPGHFDGDAILDLAYLRAGEVVRRPGLGDGSFGPAELLASAGADSPLGAFDLDGDGVDELVGSAAVLVVATGEWVEFGVGCGHYATVLVDAADVNDDGLLDIVLGTGYGQDVGAVHLILSNP